MYYQDEDVTEDLILTYDVSPTVRIVTYTIWNRKEVEMKNYIKYIVIVKMKWIWTKKYKENDELELN